LWQIQLPSSSWHVGNSVVQVACIVGDSVVQIIVLLYCHLHTWQHLQALHVLLAQRLALLWLLLLGQKVAQ
jgi:hypothetical protein